MELRIQSSTAARASFVRNVVALLVQRYGAKALEAVVLGYAFRVLPSHAIGLVFFVQAVAGLAYQAIDLGLFQVVSRRAAWGQVAGELLVRLVLLRALGVALLTVGFSVYAGIARGPDAGIATLFFLAFGLQSVHDLPRAAIAGSEAFARLSAIGLVGKAVECLLTVAGFALGIGLHAWLVGRVVGQVVIAGLSISAARAATERARSSTTVRDAVREGFPFWWATLLSLMAIRLDTIFVGVLGGMEETAELGVASRLLGGVLGVVSAVTFAAFPRLARERRRYVRRGEALGLLGVALVLGVALHVLAPFVVELLVGRPDAGTVEVVRSMAPVVSIFALCRPLETWLQAKRKEALLARVSTFHFVAVVAILAWLVPRWGVEGAAIARPIRALVELASLLVAVAVALSPVDAPLGFGLAAIPSLRRLLRRRHDARVRSLVATEGASVAEIVPLGSFPDEPGFAHHRVIVRSTSPASGRVVPTFAGRIELAYLDGAIVDAIATLHRTLASDPFLKVVAATRAFIAMQQIATTQSRADGRVRLDLLRAGERAFDRALDPATEIPGATGRPSLAFGDPVVAARILASACARLGAAFASLPRSGRRALVPVDPARVPTAFEGSEPIRSVVALPLVPGVDAFVLRGSGFADVESPVAFERFVVAVGPHADRDDRSLPFVLPDDAFEHLDLVARGLGGALGDELRASTSSEPAFETGLVLPSTRDALAIEVLAGVAIERAIGSGRPWASRSSIARRRESAGRAERALRTLGILEEDPSDPSDRDPRLDARIRDTLVRAAARAAVVAEADDHGSTGTAEGG